MLQPLLQYKHYILLVVSLGLLFAMILTIDTKVFVEQIGKIKFPTYLFCLVVFAFTWLLRAIRLFLLSKRLISIWTSFRLQISAFALNLAYPAKTGDLLMASFLKKYIGGRYQGSVALMLHLRLLDLTTLAFITFVLISPVSLSMMQPPIVHYEIGLMFWVLLLLGAVFLGSIFWLQDNERPRALQNFLPERIKRVKPLFKYLVSFHQLNRIYFISIGISLMIWLLEASTIQLIALQIHPEVSFITLLLAMSVGNLLKVLPLFPGGLGTYEAGFILILTAYGIPIEVSVTLSIVDHLLKKLVNLVVGFPSYLLWHYRNPATVEAGDWSHLKT